MISCSVAHFRFHHSAKWSQINISQVGTTESCGTNLTVQDSLQRIYITLGVKNCIRCVLERSGQAGSITWRVQLIDSTDLATVGPSTIPYAELEGETLVLPALTVEVYIQPGSVGSKQVICSDGGMQIGASFNSPGIYKQVRVERA